MTENNDPRTISEEAKPFELRLGRAAPETMLVGDEQLFVVYLEFRDGSSERVDYKLTNNNNIFDVVNEQRLIAVRSGRGTVTIEVDSFSLDLEIRVFDSIADTMKILPQDFTLEEGSTFGLIVEQKNAQGMVIEGTPPAWSVAGTTVSVDESGVVKGIAPGRSSIIARTQEGLQATTWVDVLPFEPEALAVHPSEDIYLEPGETQAFSMRGLKGGLEHEFKAAGVRWTIEGLSIDFTPETESDNNLEVAVVASQLGESRLIVTLGHLSRTIRIVVRPLGFRNTTRFKTHCTSHRNRQLVSTNTFDNFSRLVETVDENGRVRTTYDGDTPRILTREYDFDNDGTIDRIETVTSDILDRPISSEIRDANDSTLLERNTWEYRDMYGSVTFRRFDDEGREIGWRVDRYNDRKNLLRRDLHDHEGPILYTYDLNDRVMTLHEGTDTSVFLTRFDSKVDYTWVDDTRARLHIYDVRDRTLVISRGYGSMVIDLGGNVMQHIRNERDVLRLEYDYTCDPPPPPR